MNVGIFQCAGAGLTPVERLSKLYSNLDRNNLDLVVCPELFISGYNVGDYLIEYANTKHGDWSNRVSEIASETTTAVIYGYPEKDADQLYNSALCVDADGHIVANHRKLLLPPGFEKNYFSAGNQTTLFSMGGFTFSILICYDAEYPEAVRSVAQAGAQVVIVPTALEKNWGVVAEKLMPTRAFENGVWLLYANHSGIENELEYFGGSCVIAPDGKDVARADTAECMICATIDVDAVRLAQRRLPYLTGAKELCEKILPTL